MKPVWEYKYSDDRLSLALEIRDTLAANAQWCPYDWAGPDLITAIGILCDRYLKLEEKVKILEMKIAHLTTNKQ